MGFFLSSRDETGPDLRCARRRFSHERMLASASTALTTAQVRFPG